MKSFNRKKVKIKVSHSSINEMRGEEFESIETEDKETENSQRALIGNILQKAGSKLSANSNKALGQFMGQYAGKNSMPTDLNSLIKIANTKQKLSRIDLVIHRANQKNRKLAISEPDKYQAKATLTDGEGRIKRWHI